MTTNRLSGTGARIDPIDPYRLGCFGGRVDFIFATFLFFVEVVRMLICRYLRNWRRVNHPRDAVGRWVFYFSVGASIYRGPGWRDCCIGIVRQRLEVPDGARWFHRVDRDGRMLSFRYWLPFEIGD